jgi:hypothetical protein
MHTRRPGRLSAATAQRVLDGGDGPPPLPQLLAAASAPGTTAELRGESAARAAFRSSQRTAPLPHGIPRRSRVHTTSAIVITKAIAAIALTASTAGGIALATTATPAEPQARTTTASSPTGEAAASSLLAITPEPDEETRLDDAGEVPTTGAPGPRGGAAGATPETKAVNPNPNPNPNPTGRCRAASNNSAADDKAGKAAESPAFADLSCTDTDPGTDGAAGATRPTGRPDVPPGNPGRRTGKPDTDDRSQEEAAGEGGPDRADKPDKSADDRPGAARAGDAGRAEKADRGESGENRRNN